MNLSPGAWRRDLILLFLAIGLFFCLGLGARPYLTPSEARYIEVPRQMLVTHDWLTPRINGVPYFEKPPLFYWMQAAAIGLFGRGEFAGRMVTALLSTLLCLITYATGRMLYGRLSGLLAAGIMATCVMGYALSRAAMLDVPVSLFLTMCIACFLAAQHSNALHRRRFYLLMYVAAALAVMTKGLIGIVIPGMVIGGWIAATGRWRILQEARLFTGLAIVLVITVPWHWLMAREHPHFLNFYFINEHFTRYLTDSHKRVEPWWFFIAILLAGLLPWTGLLPAAASLSFPRRRESLSQPTQADKIDSRLRGNDNLFLLLWIILPFLFFSASHSKLAPYILPVFPPIAIIMGRYLAACWQGRIGLRALRANSFFIIVLFGGAIAAYTLIPLPKDSDAKIALASLSVTALLPIIAALAVLLLAALHKPAAPKLIGGLMLLGIATDISVNYAVAPLDHASVKPLVNRLAPQLRPDDWVVAYGSYFQDLPVYLNRNIIVAGWNGELDFGVEHYPETHQWMMSAEEFWQRCASKHHPRIFVFMKKTTLAALTVPSNCPLRVIDEYGKTALLERPAQ